MSKRKQAMALFKEYGAEAIKRIDKILELEKPIMIDFSDIESACNTHGDDFYDFCNWLLNDIRESAKNNHVYVFIDGDNEVKCQVSRFDVDPTKRDWSLKDELFDYNLGSFSELINLDSDFGDKEFDNFICLSYQLGVDENVDDWDEDDEVWDYYIETFGDSLPKMKTNLNEAIENMREVVDYIENKKRRLWDEYDNFFSIDY